ncbi:alpha/beta hydrolase [Streptosporangium sp. NPDC004379]|uniref:alpha/beta hydrolase n=1 Tax=Streptosporangium sp. NPDC004379 TaxID=3366189 RepID=UPI0036D106EA
MFMTEDDVRIDAAHTPSRGPADLGIVVAHGFTGSLRELTTRRITHVLSEFGGVVSFDFRGHGRSGGLSTVGDLEVLDLEAAVRHARMIGYTRVATVGFSMGAAVVVRHAGLRGAARSGGTGGAMVGPAGDGLLSGAGGGLSAGAVLSPVMDGPMDPDGGAVVAGGGGPGPDLVNAALTDGRGRVDAVISVSSPARWYYRGTKPMRQVHWAIERRLGRWAARVGRGTRIRKEGWDPVPLAPYEAAATITPTPLLVVHGDADSFFPVEHALQLYGAARDPRELWIEPGFGHAETAATPELIRRIGAWVSANT